jgi:hypothetical protein
MLSSKSLTLINISLLINVIVLLQLITLNIWFHECTELFPKNRDRDTTARNPDTGYHAWIVGFYIQVIII